MSEGRPAEDKKRRALLANDFERALKRAAPEMACMFYELVADIRKTKAVRQIISGCCGQT
jgi:hypothetical protein